MANEETDAEKRRGEEMQRRAEAGARKRAFQVRRQGEEGGHLEDVERTVPVEEESSVLVLNAVDLWSDLM
eukprot:747617-Hanusia_phi.AAC.3